MKHGLLQRLTALAASALALGALAATPEYQVKAAMLFSFAKFVEWPAPLDSGPLVIGVLGRDPFGPALDDVALGKTIQGRAVVLRRFANVRKIDACHILFIAAADTQRFAADLPALAAAGIVTVGEAPDFLQHGGVIQLFVEDKRVRFELNPAGLNASRVRLGAQLLKLGRSEP